MVKNKNPTAGWQWGSENLVMQSEPDRRAAQQQRVQQPVLRSSTAEGGQIQIQITAHVIKASAD